MMNMTEDEQIETIKADPFAACALECPSLRVQTFVARQVLDDGKRLIDLCDFEPMPAVEVIAHDLASPQLSDDTRRRYTPAKFWFSL